MQDCHFLLFYFFFFFGSNDAQDHAKGVAISLVLLRCIRILCVHIVRSIRDN